MKTNWWKGRMYDDVLCVYQRILNNSEEQSKQITFTSCWITIWILEIVWDYNSKLAWNKLSSMFGNNIKGKQWEPK